MAYRSLIIEIPARLSVRRSQLIIETDREHAVPLEDIDALLLENRQSTVTAAALSQLGESGCALFVCDERHMPCAVLQPFCSHSRASAVLERQLGASPPLKKRLWQAITVSKIQNQAACLAQQGDREGETRMLVFFDLPVGSKKERREAARFRNFLLQDGYHMLQFSVYARVCLGLDAVEKHRRRLKGVLPDNGSIRLLVITEKQYESVELLLGNYRPEEEDAVCEQLSIF